MGIGILRVVGLFTAVAILASAAMVAPVPASASTSWAGRYTVYSRGSFSPQRTEFSCVGASVQMMLNVMQGERDQSGRRQMEYLRYAQENSRHRITDDGANPDGWAAALEQWGGRPYSVVAHDGIRAALRSAARRIRMTGNPVGLAVWHGGHTWVMTGFAATADPLTSDDFKVTAVEVTGPLFPYGTLRGKPFDPAPRTWLSLSELRQKFTPYQKAGREWKGLFVMVAPSVAAPHPALPEKV